MTINENHIFTREIKGDFTLLDKDSEIWTSAYLAFVMGIQDMQ